MAAADFEGALQISGYKMSAVAQRQLQGYVLQIAYGDNAGGERTLPQVLPLQRIHLSEKLRGRFQREGGDRNWQ